MKDSGFAQNREAVYGLIADAIDIGIVIGEHSIDTVGAALALYLSLQAAGKNVQIVSRNLPRVEVSNLVGVDKITSSFSGRTKMLIISIPFKEGEVEKVSFNTEQDRMNFNITASEAGISPFDTSDISLIRRGSSPRVVFTIGVQNAEDLEGLVEKQDVKVINIDTNENNNHYGTVVFVDPLFSSVSEIVAKLINELSLPADRDIAQNLMDGLSTSTNNFSAPQTSMYAFEAAAFLLRVGAQRKLEARNTRGQGVAQPQFASRAQAAPASGARAPQPVQQNTTQEEPKDVPDDWFMPKVFKGSKKPSQ